MYTFLCQKCLIFLIYILFTKIIETFGVEMLLVCGILQHSEAKIYKDFRTILSIYVLNCFKHFLIYILRQNVSKLDKKNCQKNYINSLCVELF